MVEIPLDVAAAEEHLMRFLAVEGLSGQEANIAAAVTDELIRVGVPASAIRHDHVHQKIDLPMQVGNLWVTLPGTRAGERLVFSTHLDTVPICAGAKPKREGNRIITDGTTGLGGDNRTGCAVLVSLVETLLKHQLPHPPITLLFTVREESGIQGAKYLDPADLGGAKIGFNVDSRIPADFITGAVGQESFTVSIHGKVAHAGVAPEKGISATLVASLALAAVHRDGWFGKVVKDHGYGTSNIGIFGGKLGKVAAGDATNVVTDYVYLKGEARSPEMTFAAEIVEAYRQAFTHAAESVKDDTGESAQVKFASAPAYPSFRIPEDAPVVAHAKKAAESIGLTPTTLFSNGGLDANWFAEHGLQSVTLGAGQYEIHTVKEYVNLDEFAQGCRLAVALAIWQG